MEQIKELWIEKIKQKSMELQSAIQGAFKEKTDQCAKIMPENNNQNRAVVLNHLVESLVGTTVLLITSYGSTSKEVEAALLNSIKYKFDFFREKENGKRIHLTDNGDRK